MQDPKLPEGLSQLEEIIVRKEIDARKNQINNRVRELFESFDRSGVVNLYTDQKQEICRIIISALERDAKSISSRAVSAFLDKIEVAHKLATKHEYKLK